MKKFILTLAAALVATTASFAQTVKVHKTDGTVVEIAGSEIDYIDFEEQTPLYVGTWTVKGMNMTREGFNETWGGSVTKTEFWPEINTNDEFTITATALNTKLQSQLKNYFQPTSGLKPAADYRLPGMNGGTLLTMVELNNVNRFFSPTEQSDDKVALVGFAENPDEEDVIDMYILDYYSKSFAPEFIEWGGFYSESKPMAFMSGMHIVVSLQKK